MYYIMYFFAAFFLMLLPGSILAMHWEETSWFHNESFGTWLAWHKCQACLCIVGILLGAGMLIVH